MKKSILLEILIIISSLYGVFFASSSMDFMNMQRFLYYTIESNIFIMIICAISIIYKLKKKEMPNYLVIIKYICTVGITITFLVFAFILVPQMGLANSNYLFSLSNMTVHLISPILAIIDFLLFDSIKTKKGTCFYSMLMPVFYAAMIIGLSLVTDAALFGAMNGEAQRFPYFFMDYETNGWFTLSTNFIKLGTFYWMIIIFGLALLIGKLYLKLNKINNKKKNRYITIAIILLIAIISTLWPLI